MKTFILILLTGTFLIFTHTGYSGVSNNVRKQEELKSNTLQVASSPELSELVSELVSGYNLYRQGLSSVYLAGKDKPADASVYILTGNSQADVIRDKSGKIVIGHEIIVPVINNRNPLLEKLKAEGLKTGDFSQLLSSGADWNNIKPGTGNLPLQVLIVDDPEMISKLANFCQMDESSIVAKRVSSAEELLMAVRNNINVVGFCKLPGILNNGRDGFAEGVSIIPVDKNQNGLIDRFENIYSTPAEFTRGAWIGKYPAGLSSEVYAASATSDFDEASVDFVEWVLNDGQKTVAAKGYNNILTREKTAGLLALKRVSPTGNTEPVPYSPNRWIWILSAAALALILVAFTRPLLKRKQIPVNEDILISRALNAQAVLAPGGLLYDKTHTWTFMEKNGLVRIGIDDFLQHVIGPVSQVKMKQPGEKIRKGEKIMTLIQKGKQLDLYSPVSGIIKGRNQVLVNNPSAVNSDPYNTGWVYQVEPANWQRETRFMFMADKFKEWLDDEFVRLKDFMASFANSDAVVYNHVVFQDGGELTDNVLSGLEPEVWEDFQTHFLDVSR